MVYGTNSKCSTDKDYPYSVYMDTEHRIHVAWAVDYNTERVSFRVCTESLTDQLFGLGFSDYGDLILADFVVFSTGHSGTHHFQVLY